MTIVEPAPKIRGLQSFASYEDYVVHLEAAVSALPNEITIEELESMHLLYQAAWDAKTNGFSKPLDLLIPKIGM